MNLEEVVRRTVELSREVGDFIRQERKTFSTDKIEYKGLNDLVSYVDKTAEEKLVAGLEKILPEAGFITEEKTSTRVGRDYNWIIDPLDGTTNFIHGMPLFSISIALKNNDELIAGVIYEINMDECFYAWKGAPAYLNDAEIKVSSTSTLDKSLLVTGFPYDDLGKQDAYLKLFADLMKNCHGVRRLGSAAVDLAYTACGRFDAFYEYNLNAWDVAAGIVIVRQAGGECLNFKGGDECIDSRELVASNGKITGELLGVIQKYF
ncbi:inositol monophosphatase [Mucilaginibacter hurinus]|uniref:Inositol-1-monophosphatase n=1 Tax=Mucilaginibacter hurinus TaxID=2201324 RepID=A0A367GQ64_9SPHI|nr:inositol monophosphatase family protein [Mucilaginibacter hurinus]RCH55218.1 inositol monophosphatase [Mucilaginibacter hurinus]